MYTVLTQDGFNNSSFHQKVISNMNFEFTNRLVDFSFNKRCSQHTYRILAGLDYVDGNFYNDDPGLQCISVYFLVAAQFQWP